MLWTVVFSKLTCLGTGLEEELAFLLNAFSVPDVLRFLHFQEVSGQLLDDEQILSIVTHERSFLTLQQHKESEAAGTG